MDVNKIIMAEYSKLLDNANRICKDKDTSQEIVQMCLLSFCELGEDRQQQIINGGKLEHFITKCVSLNFNSSTSPYHRQYRKVQYNHFEFNDSVYEVEEEDNKWIHEKCDCLERELENLHWYDKHLIQKKYYEGWTYQQLHEYYNISLNSLVKDIKKTITTLKQKCE